MVVVQRVTPRDAKGEQVEREGRRYGGRATSSAGGLELAERGVDRKGEGGGSLKKKAGRRGVGDGCPQQGKKNQKNYDTRWEERGRGVRGSDPVSFSSSSVAASPSHLPRVLAPPTRQPAPKAYP